MKAKSVTRKRTKKEKLEELIKYYILGEKRTQKSEEVPNEPGIAETT
jgi:hypothetical protein